MKKIIFLIAVIAITLLSTNVYAEEVKFYEGEYIDGIWMNKVTPDRKTIYYQKARFFRQTGTNEFAYCIEPFIFFNDDGSYTATQNPLNLSQQQIKQISLIAHFGYNYHNHTDLKWYAITQLMIWKVAEPNGNYYFTDSLNGKRIDIYQQEMDEIQYLVNNYETLPNFNTNKIDIVLGENILLTDTNNILYEYRSNNENVTIKGNNLIIENMPIGEHIITLERKSHMDYNKPILFFQSPISQDLVETGDLIIQFINLNINVKETKITVEKIDYDNNTTKSSGDAILNQAVYELYNKEMNPITTLKIGEDCKAEISNLKYQTYYLKEIKAGEGYELDTNIYKIELTKDNPIINLKLANKVIKANIIINKVYETTNGFLEEKNISFEIYDSKDNLYETIITDEKGQAKIELPYGKYKVKQISTQPGYNMVEDFDITVEDDNEQTINLTNYKIKVPNTGIKKDSFLEFIRKIILIILCQ